MQFNQEVRETNFLHEFLKSSQNAKVEKDVSNETVSVQSKTEEKVATERPTEYIPTGIEPNIQEQPTNSSNEIEKKNEILKSEEDNDSGLEEGEDEESESGDDEGEESESGDEEGEFLDIDKIPTLDTASEDIKLPSQSEENLEVKPASLETPEDIVNNTETTTPEVPIETVTLPPQPEIPIETPEVLSKIVQNEEVSVKNEEIAEKSSELVNATVDAIPQNNINDTVEELKVEPEEIKNVSEPAPVNEELNEEEIPQIVTELIPDSTEIPPFDPSLPSEIKVEDAILIAPETTTLPMEIVTETPNIEETTQIPTKIDETTQTPQVVEGTTQTPQVVQEIKQAPPTPTGDMLLQRFDEKLSHKTHEHEGVGSVEQVTSHHSHSHGHSHIHDSHSQSQDNHGHHSHNENSPDHSHTRKEEEVEVAGEPAVIDNIIDESSERKPGFLNGLFKTIFGDKKESVEGLRENEPIVSSNGESFFVIVSLS